jgi:deoxyribonuclease V
VRIHHLHRWDVSPAEARAIQADVRDQVVRSGDLRAEDVHLVCAVDNAYVARAAETIAYAAAVVVHLPDLAVVETRIASAPVTFPYVPGLLSFREAPAVLAALEQVEADPDVLLFDAHGLAHPRRLGAASHLGLFLDRPSIGCAKSRLVGRYEEPGEEAGARSDLVDRGEVIGEVLRTAPRRAPVFVSIGHRVSLDTACNIVLACCDGRARLPVPAKAAHDLVTEEARLARTSAPTPTRP